MIKIVPIKNCNGYYIDQDGKVYSDKRGFLVELKPFLDSKGNYLMIRILDNTNHRKSYLIHRLVAEHYIANPMNYPEVNHIDNNKTNNKVENLEWCTRKYNLEQSYKTMSPKRNCKCCSLYINNKKIKTFESIIDACRYGKKHYNLNKSSLEKNLQCGNAKIILMEDNYTRKNVSDNKMHKQYNKSKINTL